MRSTLHLFCVLLTLLLAPARPVRASGLLDRYYDKLYHGIALEKYRQAHIEYPIAHRQTWDAKDYQEQKGAMRDRWLERASRNNVMFIGEPFAALGSKPRYFSSVIRPNGPDDQLAHDMGLRFVNGPNSVSEFDALILWKRASGRTKPIKVDIVQNLGAHYPINMFLVDALGTRSSQVLPL
ncbi:uncharacterized protein SRS1_13419 [Sporisorium reilianum f. sp. reilianum]|uniref:Uncharacterized protein n=1 Tax=Sporisorium reilianum f. sp. reilianum TaxID=72559 RepID=A0A2N8UCV0_9BASI|nr:uncharacterized protein SRS1_13419 [Sporisorium reilianum f. sp. reilianum]